MLTELYHGCDSSTPSYTAQNDSSSSISQYARLFLDGLGKSLWGRGLAFLQGEITAFGEDISHVGNSYSNFFGGNSQSELFGENFQSQLGGFNDLNDFFNISHSPTYTPLFGNQNEMAAGRIGGHLLTMLLGELETMGGLIGAAGIEGGGMALAPETVGTSAIVATPVAATVLALFGVQGLTIVREGVTGLFDDPNIRFSWSNSSSESAKGLIGRDFEDYLTRNIGGNGSFTVGGREFDGGVNNRWWEAKSGNYWNLLERDPAKLAKFKSDMGDRLRIARENGATYELFSNTPIPDSIKQWLTQKGIPFTEILN